MRTLELQNLEKELHTLRKGFAEDSQLKCLQRVPTNRNSNGSSSSPRKRLSGRTELMMRSNFNFDILRDILLDILFE